MVDIAEFAIDRDDGDTCVHAAAFEGRLSELAELLESRPDELNRRVRPYGATPLRLAVTGGHSVVVRYLLKHGAAVDLPDVKAQTPLFVAIRKEFSSCVKALLEAGANPNGSDGNRSTPLHCAAQSGYLDGVKLLLASGAETEIEHRLLGCTPGLPLHTSATYHHFLCYSCLLLNGAEPDLRHISGSVPSIVHAQVSLAHVLVKHRCPSRFAVLFSEFGGHLWQRDVRGQLATQLPQDGPCKLLFQQLIDKPQSLQSMCRVAIRRAIGKQRLKYLKTLPVPVYVYSFLIYTDLIPNACELIAVHE
ncbi:ankyrin repeat and SOCS box protein 1-like [Rhipicephalus sanguineus]|uniref:ankyrin repeat and SOCS box protein 1-like n=1 Tax=Rhipicephalus sanguineus TaxID=34632 RepID=UPI0018936572|nr:ankyrin repeat and SOCS box protein 1-like [Rhipicephalus sanguineus]